MDMEIKLLKIELELKDEIIVYYNFEERKMSNYKNEILNILESNNKDFKISEIADEYTSKFTKNLLNDLYTSDYLKEELEGFDYDTFEYETYNDFLDYFDYLFCRYKETIKK